MALDTNRERDTNRDRALDLAVAQIEKQFGKGAIMKLGAGAQAPDIAVISTGSLGLDLALGVGGLPRGRVIEIYGPESSGKTTLALQALASAQRDGGIGAFIDAEHALDINYASKLGVKTEDLLISQPDNGEQALEIAETLVRSGAIDVLVVDSVAALVPRAEIEGEMGDPQMGLQARLMSQALRKLTGTISRSQTTMIFINQIRMKIGVMFGNPETTTGGNALKFYSSVRLDIRRIGSIKQGEEVVGSRTKVKVVKNKVAPPFKEAEFDILYGVGISKEGELVDLGTDRGVIEKSGAWYSYGGDRIGQGRENAKEFLRDHPEVAQKVEQVVRAQFGLGPSEAPAQPAEPEPKTQRSRELMNLYEILAEGIRHEASDILLKVGVPPGFRIHADLLPLEGAAPLTEADVERICGELLDEFRRERLQQDMQVDLAHEHPDLGRFRVNVFRQRGLLSLVIRVIKSHIRNFAELNLPPVVERLANERRGLLLVTGTTGSGKSTTLAAMIDHINRTRQAHIITIEDPVEYVHRDRMSFINQREIGYDWLNFASALKAALRQNPDVILVGEMRDKETIETAIMAAETGHLVMSTLHTLDAPETLTRTISVFPEDQRDQVRLILSAVVRGVVSQRLIPRADGQGMVPAVEVLVASARAREYISDKVKSRELRDVIAQGNTTYGMQTFDQSLMALFRGGLITYEEALMNSSNPTDFELKVRGIASTSDKRWDNFEDDGFAADESSSREKMGIERF